MYKSLLGLTLTLARVNPFVQRESLLRAEGSGRNEESKLLLKLVL